MNHLRKHALWLILACALLAGCQTMGVPKAETFSQKLAGGYVTVSGVREAALLLGQAGKLTKADAANIQRQADTAREALDVVDILRRTAPAAASQKLSATLAALKLLDEYLKARGQT